MSSEWRMEVPSSNGTLALVSCMPAMAEVMDSVRRFAPLEAPVLIEGETGTGKELVANLLCALSARARMPMVAINCAALVENLAESELFGHERGAFTGADRQYAGRIQAADGGTLFLDEVNSIAPPVQGKLLRFLEHGEITRVGQQRPMNVDVRVLAATNVPLEELVALGRMRADFFYRVSVLTIRIPPLRDRRDDIPLLVRHFLATDPLARRCGVTEVSDELLDQLRRLPWPGNVRELQNVLRRAVVLGSERGVIRSLSGGPPAPPAAESAPPAPAAAAPARPPIGFRAWMREREREYLARLVERYRGVAEQAAAAGLPQRTLYRKMKRLGLSRNGAAASGQSDHLAVVDARAPIPPRRS
ncbi:MAG TPA: sigma-54 dependent transcriptional regulator [Candidatus Binatia bacterium]|nr:sigma-54 dependent transcriptional regulator [Candidatus Binatia bacterium]